MTPRAKRVEGDLLGGDRVAEQTAHLVGRRADDHRPLELRVVAQRDLVLALPHHHALDDVRERRDVALGHLAERRPLIAEDAGIAVPVGADRLPDPEVGKHPPESPHRMLDSRILGIRLDPPERRFGAHRSTSNSGTNTTISSAALWAKTTGRSVDKKQKPVKYWMYCCSKRT